jgi:hypothetical protein
MSDQFPPTERLPITEPDGTAVPAAGGPNRALLITLIAVGGALLVTIAIVVTLMLTSGNPSAAPSPSLPPISSTSPSPSPSVSPLPSPSPSLEEEEPEPEPEPEPEDDPPAPAGAIDEIVVTVFDGDGMSPQDICAYWVNKPASDHSDKFAIAVNWDSTGSIDRVDVVSSEGGSWPSKGAEDVQFIPFECWNGPSQARQIQITLTGFAAGTPIDTAIVIVKANAAVQITY